MAYKKSRLGPQLLAAAGDPSFFDQVHVIFGGTGAVGGATALQLIWMFEQAARWHGVRGSRSPRVVVTGRGKRDIAQFEHLLRKVHRRDHGCDLQPAEVGGFRTAAGVLVDMRALSVNATIGALAGFEELEGDARGAALERLVAGWDENAPPAAKLRAVRNAIRQQVGRPFTDFLEDYAASPGLPAGADHFRSVTQSIPLVSLAAYAPGDLGAVAEHIGLGDDHEVVDRLKSAYLEGIRDDFAHIAESLAVEVLAAHTTGVGGMYEERPDQPPVPRLDFAHRARDTALAQKQILADRLTELYAERGIKMLITAAAIGVDAVLEDTAIGLQIGILRELQAAHADGDHVVPDADLEQGDIHVYAPAELDLLEAPHEPLQFTGGSPLRFRHVIRSGENGFFTVSNADALYRVMRVTSTSELGLTLARVAALGDDPQCPTFVDSRCYYTETDNSRQVLDFLYHPELLASQRTGLQPKALQDLGSSKHQCELHTLGLLVLLHRVRTLDAAGSPGEGSASAWFEQHSRAPFLTDALDWNTADLSRDLTTLVTARDGADLAPLNTYFRRCGEDDFADGVAGAVRRAVHAVPSLGTPILFERDGRRHVLAGPYAAPVGRVMTHQDTLAEHIHDGMKVVGSSDVETGVEFLTANFGFADIRPVAVLATTHALESALAPGRLRVFREEADFVEALGTLPPLCAFTTNGLLALVVRLRSLAAFAGELSLDIGSANEFRAHFPRDAEGRALLVPGVVEAFRMVSEGWEKNTGVETLDGPWGYGQDRPAAQLRPSS